MWASALRERRETQQVLLLGMLMAAAVLGACDADDPTKVPPPPPPGQSMYDGTWVTTLGPTDYPGRRLEIEVVAGEFVHAELDSFWDLPQCKRTFTDTRLNPLGGPLPISGTRFTATGMTAGGLTVAVLDVRFTSSTTAYGSITVSLDEGGTCVLKNAFQVFDATKR